MITRRTLLMSLFLILFMALTARAAWKTDGVLLCTAPSYQSAAMGVPDAAGGAIVTWWDYRDGNYDVYAQHVDESGNALWDIAGVPICTLTSNDHYPCITTDGAGGAIIAWEDKRNGNDDIRAQRVNAAGVVQWTPNGVAVCDLAFNQQRPDIVSDGSGGAILCWTDFRALTSSDIYTQRINAAGAPQWTNGGVPIGTAPGNQQNAVITTDGAHGAIIAWQDERSGNFNIYARRVDATGTALWTLDGVAMCIAAGLQEQPAIVSDNAGGAIVAWMDHRGSDVDIYARRVQSTGVAFWGDAGGTPVTTAVGNQTNISMAAGGNSGAVLAWEDFRNGADYDIYVQRMNSAGGRPWSTDGVSVCTAAEDQDFPSVEHDGTLGAIVTWDDYRDGVQYDIYAQRVNAGLVQWTPGGVAICTASTDQYRPTIISDDAGGGIIAWQDWRGGAVNTDIYAQRVVANGDVWTPVGDTPSLSTLSLGENYPNPFSATTVFDLELARDAHVSVDVFDVAGRRVRAIDLGRVSAGSQRLAFDGLDEIGRPLASGVYFYRVASGGAVTTRKIVIVR